MANNRNRFTFRELRTLNWNTGNESVLRKLHKYGKRGNFGYIRSNFWANKNFPKLVCYVSLSYLSTSNFMQNMKKI